MAIELLGILKEVIKLDKYFKLPFFAGTLFTIFAMLSGNGIFFRFGVVTFIFGIWFWMTGAVFHLKVKFLNTDAGKKTLVIVISIIIANSILSFGIYVYLVYLIIKSLSFC